MSLLPPRRRFSPTMLRLVAAVFTLQLATSAAAIALLRSQMLDVLRSERQRAVLDVRDDLLAAYYDGGRSGLVDFMTRRYAAGGDPEVFVALRTDGGVVLRNFARMPAIAPGPVPQPIAIRRGADMPLLEGMVIAGSLPDGDRLVVAVAGSGDQRFTLAFAEAIGLTISLTVVLATLSAVVLGVSISRRTHQIAEAAAQLGSGNFGMRLPSASKGDGFDHLRLQMNLMAERIDALVTQQGTVAATLAHDLRSPLGRMIATLDLALTRGEEREALTALGAVRADAEGLRALLDNVLEINRIEGGAVVDRRQPLDLAAVAEDLAELYEPLAEQAGRRLAVDAAPVTVRVDRELLARALANLIDNALKYGGETITLTTRSQPGWAEVAVTDNGPGIAPADRARVVERHVRLDNARTLPGGGLGLAMVDAVARLHGGELVLSGEHGLVATLRLPL